MSSDYLYRITKFTNVIDLFETGELHFASPSTWEDPYEKILKHKRSDLFFAQCWSKKAQSDAMWRIYSTERTGIRIRTSREKLATALKKLKEAKTLGYLISDVKYVTSGELDQNLAAIATEIRTSYKARRAADALLFKRAAFDHEAEVRVILNSFKDGLPFLRVPVDPHDLIENIYFDPRADPTFEKVCTHYLKTKIKYKGPVVRSSLYRDRATIQA